jgi:hypothetical protein
MFCFEFRVSTFKKRFSEFVFVLNLNFEDSALADKRSRGDRFKARGRILPNKFKTRLKSLSVI